MIKPTLERPEYPGDLSVLLLVGRADRLGWDGRLVATSHLQLNLVAHLDSSCVLLFLAASLYNIYIMYTSSLTNLSRSFL